jgi:hypothetical protein
MIGRRPGRLGAAVGLSRAKLARESLPRYHKMKRPES